MDARGGRRLHGLMSRKAESGDHPVRLLPRLILAREALTGARLACGGVPHGPAGPRSQGDPRHRAASLRSAPTVGLDGFAARSLVHRS
jgi:hypothetical protein